MTPFTSEDYTLEEARRQAELAKGCGRFARVVVRRAKPDNGRPMGRVWVTLKAIQPPAADLSNLRG